MDNLEGQLQCSNALLQERSRELEKARQTLNEQSMSFEARLSQEVAKEKEKAAMTVGDLQKRYDNERKQVSSRVAAI